MTQSITLEEVAARADRLHEIQNRMRLLQSEESTAKSDLAEGMVLLGANEMIGSFGQKYQLARPPAKYIFAIPEEEYTRLGIAEACTPPTPGPKLTKTALDKLLKNRQLDDMTVAEWQQKGWYVIDRSDELVIKQVTTKLEDFQAAVGF